MNEKTVYGLFFGRRTEATEVDSIRGLFPDLITTPLRNHGTHVVPETRLWVRLAI